MSSDLNFLAFSFQIVIPRLLEGMLVTLKLSFLSAIFGIMISIILVLMRVSNFKLLKFFTICYVAIFRGTPLLLQILFIYFALPTLLNCNLDALPAGVLALSLNSAAYLTEIFRSGIESIPKGQTEASLALGLSKSQTLFKVIIPQTYRRIIPPVMNEFSSLTKETSLVSVISLSEMLYITQRLGAKYLRPWEVYIWSAIGYLIIVLFLSYLASQLEKYFLKRGGV